MGILSRPQSLSGWGGHFEAFDTLLTTFWKQGTEGQLGRQMKQTPLFSDSKVRPRAGGAFSGVPARSLIRRL